MTALAIVLMVLFAALHLPSNYYGESQWGQVQTSVLKGTEFVISKVKPPQGEIIFQAYGPQIFLYYDSDIYTTHVLPDPADLYMLFQTRRAEGSTIYEKPINTLDRLGYVCVSRQGGYLTHLGLDARVWHQTKAGGEANLIYNNGSLQIYDNYMWH